MKEIISYKTDDGTIYERKEDAEIHDRQVERIKELTYLLDDLFYRDISGTEVIDIIIEKKIIILPIK